MKFLLFSDLHLHPWTYGATQLDGWNSRLLMQKMFLDHMAHVVHDKKIDAVIFLGDLFHKHGNLTADVIQVAVEGFTKIAKQVPSYALIGNHDFMNADGSIHSLSMIKNTGWKVISGHSQWMVGDIPCGFISYTPKKKVFEERLKMTLSRNPKYVFMHQGIQSVKLENGFELPNEFLHPEMIPEDVHAFTGHYHRRQRVAPNMTVVGSPMQHVWSDSGDDRGYIILDTDTNQQEWYNSYAPQFLKVDCTDGVSPNEPIDGNFIKIYGDIPFTSLEGYKDLIESHGALSVEIIPEITATPQKFSADLVTLEEAIAHFETDSKMDELTKKIGQSIRNGMYGTSKTIH